MCLTIRRMLSPFMLDEILHLAVCIILRWIDSHKVMQVTDLTQLKKICQYRQNQKQCGRNQSA